MAAEPGVSRGGAPLRRFHGCLYQLVVSGGGVVITTLFAVILVACRHSTAEQDVASVMEPECRFDMADGKSDTVFLVLGMLDEYAGRRFVEDDDRVDRFYPSEQRVANVFQELLVNLAREQGIREEVRHEVVDGGHMLFRSREVAERLNSCYAYQLSRNSMVPGPTVRTSVPPASSASCRVRKSGSRSPR